MAKFFYIVRDRSGNKNSGTQEAASEEEAVNQLQAKGFIIVSVIQERNESDSDALSQKSVMVRKHSYKRNRVTSDDLTLLCRQLATLLGAGVTILKSLDIIAQQVSSKMLYKVIKDLQKQMESGLSLHEAIAKHPEVFSEIWVNLVESGEASGNLAVVLTRLATYLERNAAFKRKVVSALIYPAILMFAGLAALTFMTVKIIPTFGKIFSEFNIKLPFLTQVLLFVSEFIRAYLIIIVIAIAIGIWLFRRFIATKEGRRVYEGFLLKLPVFGEFFRTLAIERFTSEMSTLVESGVPILYSLQIVERSVDNIILGDIIRNVKEEVRSGKPLGLSLSKSNFFDPIAIQMVNIGEEIGELSVMFKRLNAFYQEYVDTFILRFTSMFEPIMLVFLGAIIGIMVIGLFLPIFEISSIGDKL